MNRKRLFLIVGALILFLAAAVLNATSSQGAPAGSSSSGSLNLRDLLLDWSIIAIVVGTLFVNAKGPGRTR